jgi:16S rRNA (guanine527-N7)-methyltransferase
MVEKDRKLLLDGLRELGLEPSDAVLIRFSSYLQELKKWNRAYSLTALRVDGDIISKHFLDSLLYLKVIPDGHWSVCDIGSGAGFPGLPMAIVRPDLSIALVELSRKKCAFLRHMRRTLSLDNTEIVESRVEDIRDRLFDIGVTRALFSVGDLVERASHLLRKGGFFVLNKGPKYVDEMRDAPGNITIEVVKVALPGGTVERNLMKVLVGA